VTNVTALFADLLLRYNRTVVHGGVFLLSGPLNGKHGGILASRVSI
jgi:hypothetical protein